MTDNLFERLQGKLATPSRSTGLTMADLRQLPDGERRLVNWILRTGEVTSADIAAQWPDAESSHASLTSVIAKGFVVEKQSQGVRRYTVLLGARRKRELPANLWQALTDKLDQSQGGS